MKVVITGASMGIGKAVAAAFAKAGYELMLCSRNAHTLYQCMEELQQSSPNATLHGFPADMSKKEEVLAFAEWVLQKGVPDILVNNAGQFLPGCVHNEAEGLLETMIETNLYSAYHLTRALLPGMMQRGSGHVFNMCSIASLHAYSNGGSYSISKYALAGFSRNLREEMKPHGIKVTAVYPGAVYTASWEGADIDPKRIMEPNDVAALIFTAAHLSPMATVEDIVLRPQLGDL